MKKQLIVTTVYLFFLLALVALIEIVWNQDPGVKPVSWV